MNDMVTSTSFISNMTSNINVGIDEVVSVFVARWEDGLFEKRDQLSKKIKSLKKELSDLVEKIEKSVNKSQYESLIPIFNLHSKVSNVSVNWEDSYSTKKNTIVVEISLFDGDKESNWPVHSKNFYFNISKEDVLEHENLSEELEGVNVELIEVMSQIKSVSRKERQIRGKISEMKLEQCGFSELINNPEILRLVELK